MSPEKLLVPFREACFLMGGISPRHMHNLVKAGIVRPVRLGRRILFDPADLRAAIERQKSQPTRLQGTDGDREKG